MNKNNIIKYFFSPKKLYGRKNEMVIFSNIFKRICKGKKELFFVSGYSGIGKSALINEVKKNIIKNNGRFISGKFDQFERNIPYSAIIQAFQHLIQQILSEDKREINFWREKILGALGPNGKVIINVIPDLELLIGKQPEIPELGPLENQNRFRLYFQKFTTVFSNKELPLVMFIDDLQWTDIASLSLLKTLITTNEIQSFLIIGAYRDNEVNNIHPLHIILDEIKKEKIPLNEILLNSLKKQDIEELLSDFLSKDLNKISKLTDIIYEKTGGNPYFIYEFLKSLYQGDILKFNKQNNNVKNKNLSDWDWDINKIRKKYVTDNIGDLLTKKISNLSKKNQEILSLCSCIGNRFDLDIFSKINDKNEFEAMNSISPIITGGFIAFAEGYYYFVHDHVQEAAYSLLNEERKKKYHYKIGVRILKETNKENLDKQIFFIIDQLNSGSDVIDNKDEILEIIKINLSAGRKAKKSAAYGSALNYFNKGIKLLGENKWKSNYDLTLSFFQESSETSFLKTDFKQMDKINIEVLKNGKTLIDKVKIYEIQIQAYIAQNKLKEAINTSLSLLKKLGINLPKKPNKIHILIELIKTKMILKGKNIDDFTNLPEMKDPYILAAIRIMISTGSAIYWTLPDLVPIMVFKVLKIVLNSGNSPHCSFYYATYGFVLCGVFGDISSGYQFGKFAINLIKKFNAYELNAKIYLIFNIFIKHWKHHLNETLPSLLKGYQNGIETGDFEYGANCALLYGIHLFYTGRELLFVESELLKYSNVAKRLKQERIFISIKLQQNLISKLLNFSKNNNILISKKKDEDDIMNILLNTNDRSNIATYYIYKLIIDYLFYNYRQSLNSANKAKKNIPAIQGLVHIPIFYLYYSLAITANYSNFNILQKKKYFSILNKNQKKMKKWAEHTPMNFLHKYYLIEAERFRIKNKIFESCIFFEKAISLAHENKYINEEAVAYELAAKLYISIGQNEKAAGYLQNSYKYYAKWGAKAKLKHIEEYYPDFFTGK